MHLALLASITIVILALLWALSNLHSISSGAQLVSTPASTYPFILKLAQLKRGELFLELGSGLGHVTAFAATHSPARATGLDRVWLWVLLARIYHRRSRATFTIGSAFAADLRAVDVVYCYLLPPLLQQLAVKFESELKPGARVITYGFPLPGRTLVKTIDRTGEHGPLFLYTY